MMFRCNLRVGSHSVEVVRSIQTSGELGWGSLQHERPSLVCHVISMWGVWTLCYPGIQRQTSFGQVLKQLLGAAQLLSFLKGDIQTFWLQVKVKGHALQVRRVLSSMKLQRVARAWRLEVCGSKVRGTQQWVASIGFLLKNTSKGHSTTAYPGVTDGPWPKGGSQGLSRTLRRVP